MQRTVLAGAACLAGCLAFGQAAWAADLPSTQAPPVLPSLSTPFFLFQDNTISYRFEPQAREPGVLKPGAPFPLGAAQPIQKNIAALTHVDAYAYGTDFFNVDFLSSNSADPAAPATVPYTGDGAFEIYALYRGTLSGNAITHSKQFSYGFIKDVSLGYGGDINTKDTAFAPRKRDLVGGVQLSFDVPGFFTVEANVYKEWNRNDFGTDVAGNPQTYANYRATPEFEATYLQPLTFTGLPLSFSGFANVILPKGNGGIAGATNETRTEILTSNRITLDVGKFMGQKEHVVDAFVGYKYWYNKFGVNHNALSGAIEQTVYLGAAVHLP
jgi:nucleoside-specific outer membrane channel protein Tsx